jgi:acetyl-CoA acetyltransferase family protein
VLEDQLDWLYRCPFSSEYMGDTAENMADDFGYQREAMDEWALMSQQRAGAAIEGGFLSKQIAPISVTDRTGERLFVNDEFPRAGTTMEKLARLRPAFRESGHVTAGNSSGITDGAAFVVVAGESAARKHGLKSEVKIVDWTCVGVPPRIMGIGPVPAIGKLLQQNSLSVSDIDYFEINEAFAVVNLHTERELGILREKTNLYGGGISIGHPPGATGVRMTITAMQHLAETKGRYAVVSMCLGAGQGMAMLIESC